MHVGTFLERNLPDQPWQRARSRESRLPSCLGCSTSRELQDVGVELLHMLHKLTNADPLGFLEHVRDIVPLLLSHAIGEHSEEVKHNTEVERPVQKSPGSFLS
jgi:hypothetical protein